MSTQALTEDVKTRVEKPIKEALQDIANGRHLTVADIAREAFREYIAKNPPGQASLPLRNGKAVAA